MLEGLKPKTTEEFCGLLRTAMTLDKEDQRILLDAIADTDTWTGNGLWAALKDRGLKLHKGAVNDHRHGRCVCAKRP
jgi:hypothetical protein